jgi:hypothetical protein
MEGAISGVDTFEYKPELQQNGREVGSGRWCADTLEI